MSPFQKDVSWREITLRLSGFTPHLPAPAFLLSVPSVGFLVTQTSRLRSPYRDLNAPEVANQMCFFCTVPAFLYLLMFKRGVRSWCQCSEGGYRPRKVSSSIRCVRGFCAERMVDSDCASNFVTVRCQCAWTRQLCLYAIYYPRPGSMRYGSFLTSHHRLIGIELSTTTVPSLRIRTLCRPEQRDWNFGSVRKHNWANFSLFFGLFTKYEWSPSSIPYYDWGPLYGNGPQAGESSLYRFTSPKSPDPDTHPIFDISAIVSSNITFPNQAADLRRRYPRRHRLPRSHQHLFAFADPFPRNIS